MTMKKHQMMRKLRQAQLRAKDPEFKMLWLMKQRQLEISTKPKTPVSPNNQVSQIMAYKYKSTEHQSVCGARGKKTSQGNHRNISHCHMNKSKKRQFKRYRGQGR